MTNKIRIDFQNYNAKALLTGIAIKISGPVGMRIIQFLRGELIACALAGAQKLEMSKELLAVDSNMIDQALDEIAKLILRLQEHPKKTRKEKNTSRKIQRICVDAYHIKVRWQHSLYILNKCLHQTVQL